MGLNTISTRTRICCENTKNPGPQLFSNDYLARIRHHRCGMDELCTSRRSPIKQPTEDANLRGGNVTREKKIGDLRAGQVWLRFIPPRTRELGNRSI